MAQRPVWLAGIAADALGFGCQSRRLGFGRLAVVQPLLVASFGFALPRRRRRRPALHDRLTDRLAPKSAIWRIFVRLQARKGEKRGHSAPADEMFCCKSAKR